MILVHKKIGETPLECLMRTRFEKNIAQEIKMTYAGRLDPMAEGLMIFLIGDECKEKEKYTGLSKTYEFEIVVGFETDTYDVLGLVQNVEGNPVQKGNPTQKRFEEVLTSFIGTQEQSYPAYSSKPVDGKPLFLHAREGNREIVSPLHQIQIYSLVYTNTVTVHRDELFLQIQTKISKVGGDFRQKEIRDRWRQVLENTDQTEFQIFACTVSCGSGTYVRQLVSDIGKKLDIPCTTFSINRTRVGEYRKP